MSTKNEEAMQTAITLLAESQTKTNDLLAKLLAPQPGYIGGDEFKGRGGLYQLRKGGPPVDVRERMGSLVLFDLGDNRIFGSGGGAEVATVPCRVAAVFDAKSPAGRITELEFSMEGAPNDYLGALYDTEHQHALQDAKRVGAMVGGIDPLTHYRGLREKWIGQAGYWRVRCPALRSVGQPIGHLRGLTFPEGSDWTPIAGSSGARAAMAATAAE